MRMVQTDCPLVSDQPANDVVILYRSNMHTHAHTQRDDKRREVT